jgi:hypothetical protein
MSSRSSRLTLGLPGRPRDSSANWPEILRDASAGSCQADGANPAGLNFRERQVKIVILSGKLFPAPGQQPRQGVDRFLLPI